MSEAQKYLIDNNLSDIVLNEKELPENTPDNAKKWIYLSDVLTQYSEQQVSKLPIHGVSESLPCVMSSECEIIRICADEDTADKVMKEFKAQYGGEWYVDDVRIEK